jgi:glycosyltransferase involved in cell wall biosynthesis
MSADWITIILPVKHYVPRHLVAAVESVTQQTSGDWRLLVVAHESVADEVGRLLAHARSDPRCRLVRVTGNLARGINLGMAQASSDFATLLLGDDLLAAETVAVLRRAIRDHPTVDFFHSARRIVDSEGRAISTVYPSRTAFTRDDFIHGSPVKHLLCWRLAMARAIGGVDESVSLAGPDDYDFPWTMFDHGAVFRALPECLYIYRNHCDGFRLTTHVPATVQLRGGLNILRKHGVGWWRSWFIMALRWHHGLASQAIYGSRWSRAFYRLMGYDATKRWRQPTYR